MKQKRVLYVTALVFVLVFPLLYSIIAVPGLGRDGSLIYKFLRLCGLMSLILFGVQTILGAKIKFIERHFGHDKMLAWHRKFGIAALILVLFHVLAVLPAAAGREERGLLLGAVAFFLFLLMLLFVLVQRLFQPKYEYWLHVHQLNYLIFPLAYLHALFLGSSIRTSLTWQIIWILLGLCFGGVLVYKTWHEIQVRRNRFQVARVVQETSNVWTIHFQPRKLQYLPGQFMVLRLAQNGMLSEPHPFTISSSPGAAALSVTIKAAGDFTNQIGRTRPGDSALIDAPYGRFSFLAFPADKYVFIAGGIGITPFLSMLRYLRDQRLVKQVLLFWGNRTEQDILVQEELAGFEKTLSGFRVVHVLSAAEGGNGEKGFITAALIQKYAGALNDQEIFVCGPPVMMKLVLRELHSLHVPQRQIHFERFSW